MKDYQRVQDEMPPDLVVVAVAVMVVGNVVVGGVVVVVVVGTGLGGTAHEVPN